MTAIAPRTLSPARDEIIVPLAAPDDSEGWRHAVRRLLGEDIAPERVVFSVAGASDLFATAAPPRTVPTPAGVAVPRSAAALARVAIDHADEGRFSLLYRFLWRARRERGLADNPSDPDTLAVRRLEKSVRRDLHKMHAFVRFREIPANGARQAYAAWFEPDHHIVETTAPFFIRRFTNMDWTIVTPRKSIKWENGTLTVGDGGRRTDVPDADAFEAAWSAYFAAIFNPARVKVKAMQAEMPKKYWRNLPEARLIPSLIETARARTDKMQQDALDLADRQETTIAPPGGSVPTALPAIAAALRTCTDCPLHENATQAVPGEGPADAALFLVGEQPGDLEDREGRPFVGPAGQLLRQTLSDLGIDPAGAYITNAVKHFKFLVRGKARVHKTPSAREIDVCAEYVRAEHAAVAPVVTVTLGVSALRAMLGRAQPLKEVRGTALPLASGGVLVPTFHPSYLLRLRDAQGRAIEEGKFRADLEKARSLLDGAPA